LFDDGTELEIKSSTLIIDLTEHNVDGTNENFVAELFFIKKNPDNTEKLIKMSTEEILKYFEINTDDTIPGRG